MAETIKRIETLMRAKVMSPADLAEKAGVSKSALSNILNGRRNNPTSRTLGKIAIGLGTTLDYLQEGTGSPYSAASELMPEYSLDVVEVMRRLPKTRNYELLVMARALAESQAQISALARQELRDHLLDLGDGVLGESVMNELLRRLETLDDAAASSDSDRLPADEPD